MNKLLLLGAVALAINSFGQIPSYVPTNGLSGWWEFSGNADDAGVNGNNGTVNGAVLTNDRFGNPNSAYSFDGVDDYIEIPHDASIEFGTNGVMSVSLWLNFQSLPPAAKEYQILMKVDDIGGSMTSGFQAPVFDNGRYMLRAKDGPGNPWVLSETAALNTSTDYHLVAMIDGETSYMYVNGVLVDQNTNPGSAIGTSSASLIFGFNNWFSNGTSIAYNGVMDDVGFWDRLLTECEIMELYNAQTTINNNVTQAGALLTADQAGATYQWLDCDNSYAVIPGEIIQTYTPAVTGNYAVEVSMNGCVDTSACYLVDYSGVEELHIGTKELVKITDLMGRETPFGKNRVLIYVYSDGTTERIFEFE
ncbi:MAG: LamG domain-containing protein [Crocinitomicaceae bacterium]|nr:LamG domain-containing protein [Crocinitomicaceae bacterium]